MSCLESGEVTATTVRCPVETSIASTVQSSRRTSSETRVLSKEASMRPQYTYPKNLTSTKTLNYVVVFGVAELPLYLLRISHS